MSTGQECFRDQKVIFELGVILKVVVFWVSTGRASEAHLAPEDRSTTPVQAGIVIALVNELLGLTCRMQWYLRRGLTVALTGSCNSLLSVCLPSASARLTASFVT